jgi:hypothetical protein
VFECVEVTLIFFFCCSETTMPAKKNALQKEKSCGDSGKRSASSSSSCGPPAKRPCADAAESQEEPQVATPCPVPLSNDPNMLMAAMIDFMSANTNTKEQLNQAEETIKALQAQLAAAHDERKSAVQQQQEIREAERLKYQALLDKQQEDSQAINQQLQGEHEELKTQVTALSGELRAMNGHVLRVAATEKSFQGAAAENIKLQEEVNKNQAMLTDLRRAVIEAREEKEQMQAHIVELEAQVQKNMEATMNMAKEISGIMAARLAAFASSSAAEAWAKP